MEYVSEVRAHFMSIAQTAARIISEVLAGASRYTKESGLVHDVLVKKVD